MRTATIALLLLGLGAVPALAEPTSLKPDEVPLEEAPFGAYGRSVTARILIHAPIEAAYATLSDFERLPEFLPILEAVKILERRDRWVKIEFRTRYLSFFDIRSVNERDLDPPRRISTHTDAGVLKGSSSEWSLEPMGDGTELTYRINVNLSFPVPGPLASYLVRQGVPETMRAIRRRVESHDTWHK